MLLLRAKLKSQDVDWILWDTNVYRTYNDITMTIMMMGERQRVGDGTSGMGTFTMQDWDDITHELQQFWWPDDIKEE